MLVVAEGDCPDPARPRKADDPASAVLLAEPRGGTIETVLLTTTKRDNGKIPGEQCSRNAAIQGKEKSGSVREVNIMEKPIIFSGEMVKAILAGRKTQTRRVMKTQPRLGTYGDGSIIAPDYFVLDARHNILPLTADCKYRWERECPYGGPGDTLYVKEDFWCVHEGDGGIFFDLKYADGTIVKPPFEAAAAWELKNGKRASWNTFRKHQQRFMPRWVSRISLLIKDIRVERLQDISEEDAIAEGIEDLTDGQHLSFRDYQNGEHPLTSSASFKSLWDKISGKKYPWDSNPFVWVIEFEVAK
jgi:hypothetical protein